MASIRQSGARSESLAGAFLVDADLSGLDLSGVDLSGANLSRANLAGTILIGAVLQDAVLFEARLDGTQLGGADLSRANLQAAVGRNTGLARATLADASLDGAVLEHAVFTRACLRSATLNGASLPGARFENSDCTGADFGRAQLREADFSEALVSGASFDRADMRGARLSDLTGFAQASWLRIDLREIDFSGAWLARRFIHDQNYLWEFRRQSGTTNLVYWVWWATSDCGRSLSRWFAVVLAQVFLFAWAYTFVGMDWSATPTSLGPVYYSVVTLTSLGYGDVLPTTDAARLVSMIQVLVGYVMLGGMVSILSQKLARRAN